MVRYMLPALWALIFLPALPAMGLTPEEVIKLKQSGVSEKTIQMMMESENKARYQMDADGENTMGVKRIMRPDGAEAIIYSTGNKAKDDKKEEELQKERQAWEMLKSIIIDTR